MATYTQIYYHVVFSTKHRERTLRPDNEFDPCGVGKMHTKIHGFHLIHGFHGSASLTVHPRLFVFDPNGGHPGKDAQVTVKYKLCVDAGDCP
jgi:hypothetical protein